MPTASQILKIRQVRHTRVLKSPWGKLGMSCAVLTSLIGLVVCAIGIWYYYNLTHNLPSVSSLPGLLEPPGGVLLQPTRFYDRSHEHIILTLEKPSASDRQYLYVSETGRSVSNTISPNLTDATIACLDPNFWHAPAFSWRGNLEDGGATIAQRLVVNLLLFDEPVSQRRNLQEWLLGGQIMTYFGREKVLEWYLNSAEYGKYVYGADAAAREYLGKPATILTVAEAAMLTAINDTPGLDPRATGQLLRDRQVEVIQRMLGLGLVSAEEAREALKENIQLQPEQPIRSLAPAFTDLVLLQLGSQLPLEKIARGGLEVVTTLDYDLQRQAACTVQVQINSFNTETAQPAMDTGVPCDAASLPPTFLVDQSTPPDGLNAEVIVLEPQSGEILAYVGGVPDIPSPSLPAEHHAGTLLLPFLYLTGFTNGLSPASLLWDLPGNGGTAQDPSALASYHGPVRLRTALVNDYLGAADEVFHKMGIDKIEQTLQDFGIDSTNLETTIPASRVDELFSQPVSLLDMAFAYGVLANQGVMAGQQINAYSNQVQGELHPNSLLSVEEIDSGRRLDRLNVQVKPIVSSPLAYLITNVLSEDETKVANMEIPDLLDIGRPVAIKSSLSSDALDGWSIGYLPQLVVGVWVGGSPGGLTIQTAGTIGKAVMEYAARPLPVINFAVPEGISRVQVCDPSGLLVTPTCQSVVDEVFLKGNEPTQLDDLYQEYWIDRQTGLLATIFTPMELVEKKVYLVVPIEVNNWAKAVSLPVPPSQYDEIHIPEPASKDAVVTSPVAFDQIRGKITLSGTAAGDDFSYYRIQVGKGLNPQEWLQVGQDIHQPVQGGILGTWDTSGLEGNYIVELLVVMRDLHVVRALLPVFVDNSPPQVNILAPKSMQQFSQFTNSTVVLQAKAIDNQALERVEFWMDGEMISTQYGPPFIYHWTTELGQHTLQVMVYDSAGLSAEASVTFNMNK